MGTGTIRKALPIAVLASAATGLGAAAVSIGNGEGVVVRGFQNAIADMDVQTASAARVGPVVAGTEDFWLSNVAHNAALEARPVSIGDRITISANGRDRVLNVVTVDRVIDNNVVPVSSTGRPTQLLLVTCRDESNPRAQPVRFVIEAGQEMPDVSSAARTIRTL